MLFHGLRVLEVGQYIAGPATGMLLADLGAEVIKVERPGGDPLRTWPAYQTWNRNKRIVELDLTAGTGQAEVQRLIAGADVVISSLRPDSRAAQALDLAGLAKRRPDVIICTLPGFAAEMQLAGTPAWEPIIAAAAGLFTGSLEQAGDQLAVFTPLPFASMYAGIIAADSIAAALVARGRTGLGQQIEVPLHSALFLAIGFGLQRVAGRANPAGGGMNPLVTTYQCADGRWVQLHCATPRFVDGFVTAAGLEDWWEEGLLDRQRWAAEPRLLAEIHQRLLTLFRQRPAEEWERVLSGAGLCCAVCRTVEEWLEHAHPAQSGLVVQVETPLGSMRQPGRLVQADGSRHAPIVAGRMVAAGEARWSAAAPPPPPARSAPLYGALEGIRVIDLCLILAGPTCARTLAEFGADVIKIDAPDATIIEPFWLDTNRGKRSIVLDLKSPAGAEVLWKLIASADVVVENFRKGVAERLGIGYEQVAARHPGIIYASMNCYGYDGPFADWPGWEQLAQATSGMQVRYGGRDAQPKLARYAVNDYASGLAAALGVLGALYQRQRTGRGQRITTALAATAGFLQSAAMFDYPGYQRREIEGQGARGASALSRLYRCADGWLYLHCLPSQVEQLAAVTGVPAPADDRAADSPLAEALAEQFARLPVGAWVSRLGGHGIAAIHAAGSSGMLDDARLRAAGLIVTTEGGVQGTVEHIGLPHHLSATPARSGRPTPAKGADTVAVLRELGYDDVTIASLIGQRVAATATL